MKKILIVLGLLLFPHFAFAQTPTITKPYKTGSLNASGTIAVTNTFQSVFAQNTILTGRVACTVVNYGANTMWVFFGPIANATKASSVQLAASQQVYCNTGPIVMSDQVSITGTAGDAFFAAQQ